MAQASALLNTTEHTPKYLVFIPGTRDSVQIIMEPPLAPSMTTDIHIQNDAGGVGATGIEMVVFRSGLYLAYVLWRDILSRTGSTVCFVPVDLKFDIV